MSATPSAAAPRGSVRTPLVVVFGSAGVLALGLLLAIAAFVGRRSTEITGSVTVVETEIRALASAQVQLDSLADAAMALAPGAIDEARLLAERVEDFEGAGRAITSSRRMAEIPDDLRTVLARLAERESELIVRIREATAAVELDRRDRIEPAKATTARVRQGIGGLTQEAQQLSFAHLSEQQSRLADTVGGLARMILVGGVLAMILLGIALRVISRRIVEPLAELQTGITALSAGREVPVLDPRRDDEIGGLFRHFNLMRGALLERSEREVDIRRAVEEELRRTEFRLENIVNRLQDLLIVLAPDKTVRFVNPSVERIFGTPPQQVLDRSVGDLFLPEERGRVLETLDILADDAVDDVTLRARFTRPDGKTGTMELLASTLPDPIEGGSLLLAREITEQLERDAHLRQAQKMEAVGQLTGGIAHDFNNLLTVIGGNLELALEGSAIDAEAEALVDAAILAVRRGSRLVRSLLAFSRRQPLSPRRLGLSELLPGFVSLMQRALGEKVVVTLELEDLPSVEVDPAQLEAALLNLGVNARDAMPGGGRLEIRGEGVTVDAEAAASLDEGRPGSFVRISVTDDGVGMDETTRERALEPFFTTKDVGAGSGLGLSMVYGFAQQSGGFLTLDSAPGQGTRVAIYLPVAHHS